MAAEDVLTIAVVFFVSAVVLFTILYVGDTTYDKLIVAPHIVNDTYSIKGFAGIDTVNRQLDYVLLALFIGMVIGLIISSYFVGGHPIFAIVYMIVIVISVILSAVLANVWESVTAFSKFAATLSVLPITNHIILNLPLYMAAVGFIGLVVMFAKPYSEGA